MKKTIKEFLAFLLTMKEPIKKILAFLLIFVAGETTFFVTKPKGAMLWLQDNTDWAWFVHLTSMIIGLLLLMPLSDREKETDRVG